MIKAIYGEKGTGKTRAMVEYANKMADKNYGCIVFIDYGNQLIYDLKHGVRFINISEFPVETEEGLLGFICGIIAQNYDVKWIFIDGITHILKENAGSLESFFSKLKRIASKYKVEFNISVSGSKENMPEFLKEYI
ncbi:MAG: ATP-binding protein [Firmicutes bacterium]|nr:ATP-binding protein [Bacillota bacterium]